ncbi:MAG: lysophospholipid acyltransferase family protein [Nitrospirota bacterium]
MTLISDRDTYITDHSSPRSLFSKIFLSPKFMFYPQVFWIIWKNSRKAVRGVYGNSEWMESSIEITRALENVGAHIEITGVGNIKKSEGPVVFVCNHMSTLETFVLPCIIQPLKHVTFVVKKSLVEMPVFGPIMRSREPIVVSRTNARADLKTVLEEGAIKLKSECSIIIFPQSTRSDTLNPDEFNSLGVKLALKAGVPVVPVALKTDAWGVGRLIKDFGPIDTGKKIYFAFGEPMRISGRGAEEHQEIIRFIQERLDEWDKPS